MVKKDWYIKTVLGVKVDCIQMRQVLKQVSDWIESNRGKRYIVTPNPEMIVAAQKDQQFMGVLNEADLRIPDGIGLKLADKGIKRVAGVDVVKKLIKLGNKKDWRVMFLGGKLGVGQKAAGRLMGKYPDLQLAVLAGPQKIKKMTGKDNKNLIEKINLFKPDLLLVGFGHEKQEKWMAENLDKLEIKVAMGVGGAIDYLAKPWLRAPGIVRLLGLEWGWRLMLQPWRIRRQLALIRFMGLVFKR